MQLELRSPSTVVEQSKKDALLSRTPVPAKEMETLHEAAFLKKKLVLNNTFQIDFQYSGQADEVCVFCNHRNLENAM